MYIVLTPKEILYLGNDEMDAFHAASGVEGVHITEFMSLQDLDMILQTRKSPCCGSVPDDVCQQQKMKAQSVKKESPGSVLNEACQMVSDSFDSCKKELNAAFEAARKLAESKGVSIDWNDFAEKMAKEGKTVAGNVQTQGALAAGKLFATVGKIRETIKKKL
jgi:alpha-glucosidase (family GH31 glycosyl hydrolase)